MPQMLSNIPGFCLDFFPTVASVIYVLSRLEESATTPAVPDVSAAALCSGREKKCTSQVSRDRNTRR